MKKGKKISTQGTGKEENSVENIRPDAGKRAGTDDREAAGISDQIPAESINEGNEVLADIPADRGGQDRTDALHNNNTSNNYAQEVDVNTGGVDLERSPGATNQGDNPSNAALADRPSGDREAISRSVAQDAENQTGRPTGAIYGSGGDIITVSDPSAKASKPKATGVSSKKKAGTKQTASLTRMYGQVHMEENTYFMKAGNVAEGQVQLLVPKEMQDQLSGYNGKYVSVAGELSKKNKGDAYATMSVRKLASHEEISQRAYELSQQNPDAHEENWLQAENELLQGES